ncbi:gamma-glutamyl-phosphate reductase, partial [bacterium]|nr:gamma-glutamyl-phosphate reductase [bacterium]
MSVLDIAILAHKAFLKLSSFDKKVKNEILNEVIKNIEHSKNLIFEANNKDLEDAKALLETKEINQSTYNRLKLDENKMRDMVAGIKDIINLEDPTSKVYFRKELDEGLVLEKIATPIGVIGVIFEARPDVILQISSLAIKSGNAVILKGGKESYHTNKILFEIVDSALDKFDFKGAVNLLYSREEVKEMLECDKYIDLIIPRGSNSLVQ